MSTQVNASTIRRFQAYVDNERHGGNNNGYVDGAEVELFKKKCKTEGIDNVDEIMDTYNKNRVQKETEYDLNKTPANKDIETAVISALAESTVLRRNGDSIATADTIKTGITTYEKGFWNTIVAWFNDDEELLTYTDMVNKDNVLDVLDDESIDDVLDVITRSDEDEAFPIAAKKVIDSLVAAAEERHIDISAIIIKNGDKYVAGRAFSDISIGSDVIDKDNFATVAKALKEEIAKGQKTVTGANEKAEMLTMAAQHVDSMVGNGNGYIDTEEEIVAFKQFAAQKGYDIDTILEEIRDNETNGVENRTTAQKTVFSIFDPKQEQVKENQYNSQAKDISKMYADGVKDDNETMLTMAAASVSPDNVMQILNDTPDIISKLVDEYDYSWIRNLFGKDDTYKDYTTPILLALCEHAEQYGINVSDIVAISGDKIIVGSAVDGVDVGEDATDSDNVAKVIDAIKERIDRESV